MSPVLNKKNWMDQVLSTKKSFEEEKQAEKDDEPLAQYDSDNELDEDNSKYAPGMAPHKIFNPLPIFKSLYLSNICTTLKKYRGIPAPLSLVGTFLNYVGNTILYHIHEKYRKKVFYPFTEVIALKQLISGDILVSAKSNKDGKETRMQFRAKAVVIANGGKPTIPKSIYAEVPKEKLITADYLLKKDGLEAFTATLNKNPKKRKIVIIGGSHSGFSCAWVLLNGPAS